MISTDIKNYIPPNILILTDDERLYDEIKTNLIRKILGRNSYTIYRLSWRDFISKNFWIKNSRLLITFDDLFDQQNFNILIEFLKFGGKILSLPSSDTDNFKKAEETQIYDKSFNFENQYTNKLFCVEKFDLEKNLFYCYKLKDDSENTGTHFISKVHLSSLETQNKFLSKIFEKINICQNFEINQLESDKYMIFSKNELTQSTTILKSYLSEYFKNKNAKFTKIDNVGFDYVTYFGHLNTINLGSIAIFTKLVDSTMNTFDNLPNSVKNIIVLASQQTEGKGNNQNQWLSPLGCSMFTLYLNLDSYEFPVERICLLQFAAALACVRSIIENAGYESLDIKIKWPNDIFFIKKVKLGGVLVKSSIMGNKVLVKIGLGFNLNNEKPTVCLNKILQDNNLTKISNEQFSALFLNKFEKYFKMLSDQTKNLDEFMKEFEKSWIHSNQKVKVKQLNDEFVEVVGINLYGYLKVKSLSNGQIYYLQPDGNRFDMMENMIVLRT